MYRASAHAARRPTSDRRAAPVILQVCGKSLFYYGFQVFSCNYLCGKLSVEKLGSAIGRSGGWKSSVAGEHAGDERRSGGKCDERCFLPLPEPWRIALHARAVALSSKRMASHTPCSRHASHILRGALASCRTHRQLAKVNEAEDAEADRQAAAGIAVRALSVRVYR